VVLGGARRGWEGQSGETRFSIGFDFVREDANEKPPTPVGFFQDLSDQQMRTPMLIFAQGISMKA
jgi:hypothetical protein